MLTVCTTLIRKRINKVIKNHFLFSHPIGVVGLFSFYFTFPIDTNSLWDIIQYNQNGNGETNVHFYSFTHSQST